MADKYAALADCAENVAIAHGMGWDMDGVIACLEAELKALKDGQNAQNEHQTRPILTDNDLQTGSVKPGQSE